MTSENMKNDIGLSLPPEALRGWITPFIKALVIPLSRSSEQLIGKRVDYQTLKSNPSAAARRAKQVDWYVFKWLIFELLCYTLAVCFGTSHRWLAYTLLVPLLTRIVEISSTAIRIPLFDPQDVPIHIVASYVRLIILGFVNFIELAVCFGAIYAGWSNLIMSKTPIDWFDPLYLSAMTLMTVGYGDLYPTSGLRLLACCEAFCGLLLIILILGRFISVLRPTERNLDAPLDMSHGASNK